MKAFRTYPERISLGRSTTGEYEILNRRDDYLLVSDSHKRDKQGVYREGGNFWCSHDSRLATLGARIHGSSDGKVYDYRPVPNVYSYAYLKSSPKLMPFRVPSGSENTRESQLSSALSGYGATGYARARPGNPAANVGQFLGELAGEGLPSIPLTLMRRAHFFRSIGSEYLNVQFGWKPFLSDLRKMYQTWQNLDRLLAQIARDNGRNIRRRRTLEDSTTNVVTDFLAPTKGLLQLTPGFSGLGNTTQGSTHCVKTVTTKTKIWFVGAFQYYIPDIGTSQWKRRTVQALFGANLTPDLVWNLLPWSWLADWFSNMGDIMSNMSENAVSNLVSKYAYVMRYSYMETRYDVSYTGCDAYRPKDGRFPHDSIPPFSCSCTDIIEHKQRLAATPYGFNVSWNGLSAYQASILAALGITRARF